LFNVIARNCDDHTKNFTFRLKKGEEWELAPAYDICFAYRPDSVWVSQHNLSINGNRKNISKDDLLQVAKEMNIKRASTLITEISESIRNWDQFAEVVKVDTKQKEKIGKAHLTF
jgi:serine/threonine-protein kinase HipA